MESKLCKRCGDTKSHSEFYPRKWRTKSGEHLGLYPWCQLSKGSKLLIEWRSHTAQKAVA